MQARAMYLRLSYKLKEEWSETNSEPNLVQENLAHLIVLSTENTVLSVSDVKDWRVEPPSSCWGFPLFLSHFPPSTLPHSLGLQSQ